MKALPISSTLLNTSALRAALISLGISAVCGFCALPDALAQDNTFHVTGNDGSTFMDEVQSDRPDAQGSPTAKRLQMQRPADLSELGVPVNSAGHIVPMIDRDANGFMPFSSSASVTTEALPYGNYGSYVMGRSGLSGYSPYGYYGPGYRPYGYPYGPGYGYGYPAVAPGINLRIGKVNIGIGGGGYYNPGFANSGYLGYGNGSGYYGPGAWAPPLTPYTTSPMLSPYVAGGAAAPYAGGFTGSGAFYPGGVPYVPTMYSSSGLGGFKFSSSGSGTTFGAPFSGYKYKTYSTGGFHP